MPTTTRRQFFHNTLLAGGAASLPAQSTTSTPIGTVRQSVSLLELGGVPDNGKFDNAKIINAALKDKVRSLYIPDGSWHLRSRVNPITYPLEIIGSGCGTSCLVRDYAARSPSEGLLTASSGAVHIARVGLLSGHNSSGGAGIALIASDSGNPDYSVIEDVYVSVGPGTSGTWAYGILVDGTARTGTPIGVRDIDIRNCSLFACTSAACRISGGVAISIRGGGMFPAAGTTGKLEVTGTSTVASHYVSVDTNYVGGLVLDNCKFVNVKAALIAGDIINTKAAEDVMICGSCSGTVQKFYTRGTFLTPG
jgi:hypothetical protein